MKITKVETFVLSNKLKESFFFSQWEYNERRICIVKITTDDGQCGWGEGYGPADVIKSGINLVTPLLIGENPLENERLWFNMYRKTLDFARRGILVASISAIDVALWDLKGKILNQPISVLMGGQHRTKVIPYATGLYFSESDNLVAKLVAEAQTYVEQGFKAIKMKVGLSVSKDIILVKSVREAIGNEVKLMIDANHAYSLREATKLSRALEQYNIDWFEEPVSPEYYHHYNQLRSKTTIPIAGGECEYLRYGFQTLLDNDSIDILQVDICGAGGLSEAKRISTLANTRGVEIIPHVWGTGIAFHAALHFIANLEPIPGRLQPSNKYIEYDRTENEIRESLTAPSIKMKNGYIDIPQLPGLGIQIDEKMVRHFSSEILI
ncbi:mandelate racemase/muconate lactonizing enzyme family protein [Aurantibacter sp.]|uniref:mandelate racemase/muconate lactonizing enzyme family protein n=1 Tax=Aurantibacter sp. TaxID=2807103 RepID=UPI003266D6D3